MHKYRLIAKKGEGTFSEVLKAQCVKNGKMTAIKCMKSQFESEEQVNNLREIQALRRLSPHPGIIKLVEVLYEQPTGRLALVFELMDMNIYELIRGRRQYLPEARIKSYMYQLIKAMDHMHRNGIFHRDIKPENILVADDVLKLADFGSCRGIYSKQPYTEYISTRWYRAPECLLTDGYYNYKMDLWGVGCVFFEIVALFPLFPGTNELDQIHKIHNIMGTPPLEVLEKFKRHATHMELNFPPKEGSGITKLIPHALEDCMDLIIKLLAYNPEDRLSARQALRHPFLKELRDLDKKVKRELAQSKEGGAAVLPSTATSTVSGHHEASNTTRAHRKTAEVDMYKVSDTTMTTARNPDERVRALPTIGPKGAAHSQGEALNQAPAQQANQQTSNSAFAGYVASQPSLAGGPKLGGGTQHSQQGALTGLPDLTSNAGMRGMGPKPFGSNAQYATTQVAGSSVSGGAAAANSLAFKVAAGKKHQTHPKKGSKMSSIPPGQKYTAAAQGTMAVGSSIHAQGVAAQKFAGVGSGKYGQTLNLNMSLTSSKYQGPTPAVASSAAANVGAAAAAAAGVAAAGGGGGVAAAASSGLSVGPAAKVNSLSAIPAGGPTDAKNDPTKYTSPYSQKYNHTRLSELDP